MMEGFPAAPEDQVTLANWRSAPFNRWSFQHVREIVPSADIPNAPDQVHPLKETPADFVPFTFKHDGRSYDLAAFLEATDTDGFVILRHGAVVCEAYAHGMTRYTPHLLMSVSKSLLGIVAGILSANGALDVDRVVSDILPEVRPTAYAGATLRNLLDMRAGIGFDEDYLATAGPIVEYRKSHNWRPLDLGDVQSDLRSFYQTLTETDGRHGDRFHYVSPNTDLLGWAIERVAGRRFADLVSELLWQPVGAERSAYITVDQLGAPRCAGGICATVRDLARVGQLIVDGGRSGTVQVIPSEWINDVNENGDADAWDRGDFAGGFPALRMHYRSQCYFIDRPLPLMFGLGVHGQHLFVNRAQGIVVAKVSSQAEALDWKRIELTLACGRALSQYLG